MVVYSWAFWLLQDTAMPSISEGIVIMGVIASLVKNNEMKYCLLVEMILCGFHGIGGLGRTAPL